ncbi:hypothetical protein BDW02DRAFT_313520 [Decorospora gaudefroyi]|uniref:Uncharacterized protein n=1 Tax=Decorospora gaudefroyi TaxID=184978 RepID=A0A6A5KN35_9PLEO|nr:hypothetical protein BDW02DRAFT_313520 [Decorospora gaudefroyi]
MMSTRQYDGDRYNHRYHKARRNNDQPHSQKYYEHAYSSDYISRPTYSDSDHILAQSQPNTRRSSTPSDYDYWDCSPVSDYDYRDRFTSSDYISAPMQSNSDYILPETPPSTHYHANRDLNDGYDNRYINQPRRSRSPVYPQDKHSRSHTKYYSSTVPYPHTRTPNTNNPYTDFHKRRAPVYAQQDMHTRPNTNYYSDCPPREREEKSNYTRIQERGRSHNKHDLKTPWEKDYDATHARYERADSIGSNASDIQYSDRHPSKQQREEKEENYYSDSESDILSRHTTNSHPSIHTPSPPPYDPSSPQQGSDYASIPPSPLSKADTRRHLYTTASTSSDNDNGIPQGEDYQESDTASTSSDSDDNGIAEGSDYLESEDEGDDAKSDVCDDNGVAEGSDYMESESGDGDADSVGGSDVCERRGGLEWESDGEVEGGREECVGGRGFAGGYGYGYGD